MIIGTVLFHALFVYMVVLMPLCRLHEAFAQRDLQRAEKWCAFLLCVVTLVVPLLYVPSYIPLRNDAIVLFVYTLSMFDASAAHCLIQRHVIPLMRQLQMVSVALQLGLAGAAAPMTPSPVSSHESSDSEEDEKNSGNGHGEGEREI